MTRANSVHPVTQADSNSLVPDLLRVGSCPNDDNFVHFCFVLFCVVFIKKYFLNLSLQRKMQDLAENSRFFVYLFPLCWNSDSKNSSVTCP